MQDNIPSQSAKLTIVCLAKKNFKDTELMEWHPTSSDVNPKETLLK